MSPICVAPIVEGHGETAAVPILIRRIYSELFGLDVQVLRPIRVPRAKLIKPQELVRAISLADLKLRAMEATRAFVLIMFDADEDLACEVAPALLEQMQRERPDVDMALILPVPEYETWFVAAAESLRDYLDLDSGEIPRTPEPLKLKKAWIQSRFRGRYTETIEQPALTARMDLSACRARSASFDKLCRELEKRTED